MHRINILHLHSSLEICIFESDIDESCNDSFDTPITISMHYYYHHHTAATFIYVYFEALQQ